MSYRTERLAFLKREEGDYPNIYLDHLGFPTAGIGALLFKNNAKNQGHIDTFRKHLTGDTLRLFNDQINAIADAKGTFDSPKLKTAVMNGHKAIVQIKDSLTGEFVDVTSLLSDITVAVIEEIADTEFEKPIRQVQAGLNADKKSTLNQDKPHLALFSRFFNGFRNGVSTSISAINSGNPIAIFKAFATSRRYVVSVQPSHL